jgi:hypothetical protein
MENLLISCSGELTPPVDAVCSRIDECGQDFSYAECVQMYNQIIGCYSAETQSAMLSCSSVGTCETFSEVFGDCMNTRLGLVDCYPVDY